MLKLNRTPETSGYAVAMDLKHVIGRTNPYNATLNNVLRKKAQRAVFIKTQAQC